MERIRSINGLAKVHVTQYSQVPQLESFLLDIHAYDGVETLENMPKAHSHLDPVSPPRPPPLSCNPHIENVNNKHLKATSSSQSHRASPPSPSPSPPSHPPISPPSNPGSASSSGRTPSYLPPIRSPLPPKPSKPLTRTPHICSPHPSSETPPSPSTAPKASSRPPTARPRCCRACAKFSSSWILSRLLPRRRRRGRSSSLAVGSEGWISRVVLRGR